MINLSKTKVDLFKYSTTTPKAKPTFIFRFDRIKGLVVVDKKTLIKAFLDAVNTWKTYVNLLRAANRANDNQAKSLYGKAVFYWIKQAEKLKKDVDSLVLSV